MSFCSEVKDELIKLRPSNCCKPFLAYGFMLFGRSFSLDKICLQTGNENVAKAYSDLLRSVYKIEAPVTVGGSLRPTFKVQVESMADRLKILASFDYGVSDTVIDESGFEKECCAASFVRGAFLACGNINDPEKEYRAEFNIKNEKAGEELLDLLRLLGINMKKSARANGFQLYTKESSAVEDLLTLMGAGHKTLAVIDTKIMKSIKNDINRARNCDNANISKMVEASIKQRQAIEYLEKTDRLYTLPEELLSAALLRKNNPDVSLKELCKISDTPLTPSGLNHRLNKIIEIYEKLK